MKSILLGLISLLLLNIAIAQNGDCTTPSTIVQNDANATPPGASFNQCISSPTEVGGKVIVYSTVTSSSNGTLGLIQSVGYNNACSGASLNSLFSTRLAELFPANNCSGVPITPSATIANPSYSSTFNPEWTGLSPNTAYTVRITITVPGPCSGLVNEVCLNQYYPPVAPTPGVYTCGTVDFNLSSAGPFVCTDPVVNLLALDPPSTTVASQWIYPGFIIKVWKLPSYSWTNQKINFLDNGVIALTQNNSGSDTLVLAIDHVQPGSYSFGITNIGARQFGYQIINAADGTIAESGTFVAGNTTTAVHSPVGTWNYTIARVGAGAVATGVSNNSSSGGDGIFDPSIAGAGTFDITYTWDNGAGCSGTKTKQVVVTCPPAPCGTVGINWQTGTAPTALNLDCSNNTDYGLKANVIAVAGNYIAPGFTIGDASGAVNFTKIEVEEGAGTGFVDVVLQKILTFCVPTFQYRIRLTGSGSGTITIKDHATGNTIYSGPFSSGMVITLAPNTILGSGTFSGPGVSNYKKNNPTVIGSGYGVFNPSVAGGGSHTITYTWNNGAGCSGSATIPVTVTCPSPTCPVDQSFIKLDWAQNNPFPAFSPTSFNCNSGSQRIWKNIEAANIDKKGELEAFPGFIMEVITNAASNTNTSVLVSVNGTPYSYYGPGPAPVGVLDWGPMTVPPSAQLILEPFLPAGANVTLQVCDARGVAQSFAYTVNDYSTGAVLKSGTATPSSGSCTTINFTLSSPVMTWNIDNNAALITNNNDGSGTFDPSTLSVGPHTINYSWNNGAGCSKTATQNITINPLIVPTFTTISPICSGDALSLPSSSTNSPAISGTWSPAIDNTNTTNYTFTPTAGQCASSTTMSVTVNQNVTPTFASISPICSGDALSLPPSSSNSPAISGTWSPAVDNTHTQTYLFTPTSGQCAATANLAVTVNQPVTPTFTTINPICSGASLSLPGSSTNSPAISGTWSPAIDNTQSQTYTFTPTSGQCASNGSLSVVVNSNVTPTFAVIQPICSGDALSLPPSSSNSPAISGTWSPAVNNTQTSTYTFTPTAGQCVTLPNVTKTVTVNQKVTPTFTAVNPICSGASLSALPIISNNSISGTWSPAIDNTQTKTYTFTPSSGQCANSAPMTITVNQKVDPTFTPISDLCINSVAPTLATTSTNSIIGSWSPSTISTSTVGSTIYTFTPAINQCGNPSSITIVIAANPSASATPSVITGNPTLHVDFTNSSSNATTLNWDFGNGSNSTVNGNTSATYSSPGTYTVTLTASNNICPDATWTQVIIVKPIDPLVVVIPNVFTPNNDGVNDDYFLDVKNSETFEATIFNRWGNEMLTLQHPTDKWNGKLSSGDVADEGTYFIKYKIVGIDQTIQEGTAFFHLGL